MGFTVLCPNDGPVQVGLENISSIIVRGEEDVEVVFGCPTCGRYIHVSAQVPRLLLATLEDAVVIDERTGEATLSVSALIERGHLLAGGGISGVPAVSVPVPAVEVDADRIERYCEYFRRQLAEVTSVDAMLAEIDSR